MKFQLTVLGCDKDFGEETIIFEDELLGQMTIREIEIDSLDELQDLLDESGTVQFQESMWDRYDGEVTILCGDVF